MLAVPAGFQRRQRLALRCWRLQLVEDRRTTATAAVYGDREQTRAASVALRHGYALAEDHCPNQRMPHGHFQDWTARGGCYLRERQRSRPGPDLWHDEVLG